MNHLPLWMLRLLTGACVVALGNVFSGYFCKDEDLRKKITDAAEHRANAFGNSLSPMIMSMT